MAGLGAVIVAATLLPASAASAAPVDATVVVAPAAAPLASAPLPYAGIPTTGWTFLDVPPGSRPYESSKAASLSDPRAHTSTGVRLVVIGGKTYNHPVGQAARGLEMLNGYRVTKDSRYLAIALANASRLVSTRVVDTSVVSDGAWFYPHRYPFSLHRSAADTMPLPWYSAMAQGEALSLFSRLAQATGSAAWRSAADRTFASFLVPQRSRGAWVVEQDSDKHVWLEEFAAPGLRPAPDHTFNGHNFATAGLADYVALTHDPRATTLLDGALTSSLARLPRLENPRWKSHYCLRHPAIFSAGYHRIHWSQMLWFQRLTGDTRFARWADTLEYDYPTPEIGGRLALVRGTHVGRRLDAAGRLIGTVTVRLGSTALVSMDRRERLAPGSGIWLHITSGTLAGTWVPEAPGFAYAYGARVRITYPLTRTLVMPGTTTPVSVVLMASSGATLHSGTITTATSSTTRTFGARATVNGVDRLRITSGRWSGWWIAASSVTLDPPA
ncbi:MAG TPA: D-glucuronyl C5-epimerase family protein [Candidatus Nanopelagicales bacterium]|nr:D-glucuronyl C5-epimerase family protein [Candidatus Nanopelagicales bacterium]